MDAIPVTPTVTLMIPPRPGAKPREVIVDLDTVTALLAALEAAHAALETTEVVLRSITGGGIVVDAAVYCDATAPHSGRKCTLEAHDGAHHESHVPGRPLVVWDDEPESDEEAAAVLAESVASGQPVTVTDDEPVPLALITLACTCGYTGPALAIGTPAYCHYHRRDTTVMRAEPYGQPVTVTGDEPPPWPDARFIEEITPLNRSQLRAVIRDAHDLAPQAVERALAIQRDPDTWTRDGEPVTGRDVLLSAMADASDDDAGEPPGAGPWPPLPDACGFHGGEGKPGADRCRECARTVAERHADAEMAPVSYLPLSSERLHGARTGGTS